MIFKKNRSFFNLDICYGYLSANGGYYIKMFYQESENTYAINHSLSKLETMLDPGSFFRISPSMIIHFKTSASFRQGKGRSLELTVSPSFVDINDG